MNARGIITTTPLLETFMSHQTVRPLNKSFLLLTLLTSALSQTVFLHADKRPPCRFDAMAGEQPQETCELRDFLRKVQKTESPDHLRMKRGDHRNVMVFEGPPGTGKTTAAKVIAEAGNAKFIYHSAADLVNKFQGSGAASVRQIFEEAEEKAKSEGKPVVVCLDEIEAVVEQDTQHDSSRQASMALRSHLSQMREKKDPEMPVVVILCTNRLGAMDPALRDRSTIVTFGLPDAQTREELFTRRFDLKGSEHDRQRSLLARKSDGLSHRSISEVLQRLLFRAKNEGWVEIDRFTEALQEEQDKQKRAKELKKEESVRKYRDNNPDWKLDRWLKGSAIGAACTTIAAGVAVAAKNVSEIMKKMEDETGENKVVKAIKKGLEAMNKD